jgi:transposase-like protein
MNLVGLVNKFHSEEKCRAYLEALRWPDGPRCPRCQEKGLAGDKVSRIHDRDQFDCDSCRFQFSVTAGTIFHDTKLPLWKWFLAVYMMVESKKGISANQLKRTLEVSYRTAWYLCHRIRKALETEDSYLRGVVEVDETWVGGNISRGDGRKQGTGAPRIPGGNKRNKTLVIGAVQRGGEVRLKADPDKGAFPNRKRLGQFLRANIGGDAVVYTDEHPAYPALLAKQGNEHATVPHKSDVWIVGDVHTNGIEGAWSLFKRSVVGSYHQLSCKHMNAYLDEFEFRYNNRENPYIFRDAMKMMLKAENLEYKELTA